METRSAKRRRMQTDAAESDHRGLLALLNLQPASQMGSSSVLSEMWGSSAAQCSKDAPAKFERVESRFAPFRLLPTELRLEIWRLVEEQERPPLHPLRVRMYRGYERTPVAMSTEDDESSKMTAAATSTTSTRSTPTPSPSPRGSRGKKRRATYSTRQVPRLTAMPDLGPATRVRRKLLRICREARYEYLRRWPAVLGLDRGGLLRVSPEEDLVYLDVANRAVMDDLALLRTRDPAGLPAFVHGIRHLGLEMTPHLPQWLLMARDYLMPRLEFVMAFPQLQSLSLVNFGCFDTEVAWSHDEEVHWLLSRAEAHNVFFRSFAVLPDVAYIPGQSGAGPQAHARATAGPRVGRQTSSVEQTRHDCAICSIHRCVHARDILRNRGNRVLLTDEERARLTDLKFHTLLAATRPELERHMDPIDADSLVTGTTRQLPAKNGEEPLLAGGHHHGGGIMGDDDNEDMFWGDEEEEDDDDDDSLFDGFGVL